MVRRAHGVPTCCPQKSAEPALDPAAALRLWEDFPLPASRLPPPVKPSGSPSCKPVTLHANPIQSGVWELFRSQPQTETTVRGLGSISVLHPAAEAQGRNSRRSPTDETAPRRRVHSSLGTGFRRVRRLRPGVWLVCCYHLEQNISFRTAASLACGSSFE